jgi:hypothetical protein
VHITHPEFGELGPDLGAQAELDLSNALILECTAPYPVEWVLGKYDFGKVVPQIFVFAEKEL